LLEEKDLSSQECPICCDVLQTPVLIQKCGHLFCKECIQNFLNNENDQEKNCPSCRGPIHKKNLLSLNDFYEKFAPERLPISNTSNDLLENTLSQMAKTEFKSSTKIDKLLSLLKQTRRQFPNDKTIVFSQFVGFLDLIETPLKTEHIPFVRYDGSMNAKEREQVLSVFRENSKYNVILVSLKCGSLGLNLTCANRVCLMDVWWNIAFENQAIDRVHRFGQTKRVEVHRICITNSVEDRILELQEKKQQLANAILDEGERVKSGRLGIQDLMMLFNVDREDV
jgi:SNF2 family DNA or RNA helicase